MYYDIILSANNEGVNLMRKHLDRALVLLVLFALLLGLGKALLRPKETNFYENRTANQPPRFTAVSWAEGSFQDALEAALTDQIPLAQKLEYGYHQVTNGFLKNSLLRLSAAYPNRYFGYHDLMLLGGDRIVYPMVYLDQKQELLDKKADGLNALFSRYPSLLFYVYYIEKDTDLNFESGELSGISDYVLRKLNLPEAQKGCFSVRSYDDFKQWFYRTDHHWNCDGSYRGYQQVMAMLGKSDVLSPLGQAERIVGGMSGAKARVSGGSALFTEDLYAYRYPFPEMDITIDGTSVDDYGMQDAVFTPEDDGTIGYSNFYGGDDGEIVFHTQKTGAGNLLILGESFDNAILKLIASGFENTYSVDLRNYEHEMGVPFRFGPYIEAHQIDQVLLIGNVDYFLMEEFLPEETP